jgi:hypothetical protein
MLRWIFSQSLMFQYTLLLPAAGIAGVLVWAAFGRRARLLGRARRAARQAQAAARAEGLRVRDVWVTGAVDVDPSSLAIIFHIADDATLAAAVASGAVDRLRARTLQALRERGYPSTPNVVELVSDETVERAGGPNEYFR